MISAEKYTYFILYYINHNIYYLNVIHYIYYIDHILLNHNNG